MTQTRDKPTLPPDPCAVLGVAREAGDEEIRAAYVRKVKEFPPDRNPAAFELVRDAYELLRDRRQRIRHFLLSVDPQAPVESILEPGLPERRLVGPEPWLAVLKEK